MSCEIIPYLLCATVFVYIVMEIKYIGKKKMKEFDSILVVLLFIACLFAMLSSTSTTSGGINSQWQNVSSISVND